MGCPIIYIWRILVSFYHVAATTVLKLERTLIIKISLAQQFSAWPLLTFRADSSLLWRVHCTLQDVEQHPWSLDVNSTALPPTPLWQLKMSPDFAKDPLGPPPLRITGLVFAKCAPRGAPLTPGGLGNSRERRICGEISLWDPDLNNSKRPSVLFICSPVWVAKRTTCSMSPLTDYRPFIKGQLAGCNTLPVPLL